MKQEHLSEYVFGKVPPSDPDIEQAVLGAVIVDNSVIDKVIDRLRPDVFYKEANQGVCAALVSLAKKSMPIDMLTVTNELKEMGTLEDVGGPFYVVELAGRVASAAHIEHHIDIIYGKYIQRKLGDFGMRLVREAYEETVPVKELLQSAEKGIFEVTNEGAKKKVESISDIVAKSIKKLEEASKTANGLTGVPCGFTTLDRVTGGWQDTDLIILAARPSQGKTALGLNIAKGAAEMNRPVAFFSLEMSNVQLVNRLLASDAEINGEHILRGTMGDGDWGRLMVSAEAVSNLPLFIDDTSSLNILELKSKCRKLKMDHNIKLIVVDYLQLMTGERQRGDSRDREIGTISAGLKAIAKELEVPVIALSQLSRDNEKRGGSKRPVLSDLRESGNLEQDADIVMFIHRPEYYGITEDEEGNSLKGVAEIIFAKHRNGAVGGVELTFKPEFTKFSDKAAWEPDWDNQPHKTVVAVTPSQNDEPIPF